ncbi:MAG: tyrosine-type recombinase/integrase [Nitrosarchaeum sp.]|jgi:integrase|uniref:tyrosine-type recombinase/integrase n=1 Tax=Nitrosarchaeum sp. TaxID=2026886 RepID=UPI002DE833EA|nr:tyrosine-type recombinase/integrase [Nitrosarchaeum sp.]MEC4849007.1 tyrosine-type recombinase/integrase [Nitrosarchaeum sp.]
MQELPDQKAQAFFDSVFIMSHSYSTVSSYRLAISNKNNTGFRDFLLQRYKINELEFAEQIKQEKFDVYEVMRDYVVFLDKNNYKPKTITSRLAAIKGYLRFLGLKIYTEDCKHIIRVPKNIQEPEVALTKEIILRVLRNAPPRLQTVMLVLSSSGMRIGELVQLKLSDIDFTTTPTTIRLRAQITKTRHARETFITAEATDSLKDYLSRFLKWDEKKDNSHLNDVIIFGRDNFNGRKRKENPKQPDHLIAEGLLMRQLKYYLEKIPDLNKTNTNGIRVIHYHALRKFFRTTVGNVSGRDFAEALIGHQFYMSTYYQLNDEKKKEMYLEVEPYLTISDFKTVEKNIKILSAKNTQLEEKFNDLLQYLRTNKIEVPNL